MELGSLLTVTFAPDSFKGSIAADSAAAALARGWASVRPKDELVLAPMADGGEGTLSAIAGAVPQAELVPVTVTGPDGQVVLASWLRLPPSPDHPAGAAVIELAATSGIELMGELDALGAHTLGLGEAIAAACETAAEIYLALGSSASTDGGTGMLRALGLRALDAAGSELALGGGALANLAELDFSNLLPLPARGVVGLTDVTNPLLGKQGAAQVFAAQKGASAEQIAELERALGQLVKVVDASAAGRPAPGLGSRLAALAGSGAAGGTGFGVLVWGGSLRAGAPAVAAIIGLKAKVARSDLVITGEGSYDRQSAMGKVPGYLASVVEDTPLALVAGQIDPAVDRAQFAAAISLSELSGSSDLAMAAPEQWLEAAGAQLARQQMS
jgi:glycerate kinase